MNYIIKPLGKINNHFFFIDTADNRIISQYVQYSLKIFFFHRNTNPKSRTTYTPNHNKESSVLTDKNNLVYKLNLQGFKNLEDLNGGSISYPMSKILCLSSGYKTKKVSYK